jgi:hypothetical protein
MRVRAILVVIDSESRAQLGKRLDVSGERPAALVVERGQARLELGRGLSDRRLCAWLEPVGRWLLAHSMDARVLWNGRDLPAVGAVLADGDELTLGNLKVRVRIADDLEAAYHEVVYGLTERRTPVDRHAN